MNYLPKAQLIETIQAEHTRLAQTLAAIAPAHMLTPGVLPGQSCKDILAHLTAWEQRMLQLIKAMVAGSPAPLYPATGPFNEQIYRLNNDRSLEAIQTDFDRSYGEALALISQLSDHDLARDPVWKLIGYNTYNHYKWARTLIWRWQRTTAP